MSSRSVPALIVLLALTGLAPALQDEEWIFVTLAVGNVDDDPEPEYLVVLRKPTRDREEETVRIRFFDYDPEARTWIPTEIHNESQESESRLFPEATGVELRDIDRDGRMEIVISPRSALDSPSRTHGLLILGKRGKHLAQLFAAWEGAPELRDLDGDGIAEIVLHAEYVGPLAPDQAILYPIQVFAYEEGTFRRALARRYAAYFEEYVKKARAEYEMAKDRAESDALSLFRLCARVLLAFKAKEDIEGMRAYYRTERPWLHARLPLGHMRALDELVRP